MTDNPSHLRNYVTADNHEKWPGHSIAARHENLRNIADLSIDRATFGKRVDMGRTRPTHPQLCKLDRPLMRAMQRLRDMQY